MSLWQNIYAVDDFREMPDARTLAPETIQSQYAASKHIVSVMKGFDDLIDPRDPILRFYRDFYNIYTANTEGLNNWGRILVMDRMVEDETTGFSVELDDENYRMLLLYKAAANIGSSDIPTMTRLFAILMNVMGESGAPAYVLEAGKMMIRYVSEEFMSPLQMAMFKKAGILTKGAGVGWELYAVNPNKVFGFFGSGMRPFNQAPFVPDNSLISTRVINGNTETT